MSANDDYSDWSKRTVLLVRHGDRTARAGDRAIEAVGARAIATDSTEALQRLRDGFAPDAVFLDVADGPAETLDALIEELTRAERAGHFRSVLCTQLEYLDLIDALCGDSGVILLCSADDIECTAALGLALVCSPSIVAETNIRVKQALLARLGQETAYIAERLGALAKSDTALAGSFAEKALPSDPASKSAFDVKTIRAMIARRRRRDQLFGEGLFADPAWDMLLDLAAAQQEDRRVSVSSLCIASAVAPTTALRYIRVMTERGIVLRRPDPEDHRRIFIELSLAAEDAMRRWFAGREE